MKAKEESKIEAPKLDDENELDEMPQLLNEEEEKIGDN